MQQTHVVCCQGWKKRHPGALTCDEGEAGSSWAWGQGMQPGLGFEPPFCTHSYLRQALSEPRHLCQARAVRVRPRLGWEALSRG